MRKHMYKCMMSALAAVLFLPYIGTMPVSAQEAVQSIAAAGEAAEPVITWITRTETV